ncbi:trypsin-7-like [Agrilus planipennis]|uniref:Trypsin-7-like n=1 Tax=Agrilus planipennis TaxID=224129 RepID=A0A1W4X1D7_AGRPL|nr:trypsin-7-like [Agrilus planipennis]
MKCYFALFCTILLWNIVQSGVVKRMNYESPFQYMVEIYSNGVKTCDGTVISKDWILTTANCTHGINKGNIHVSEWDGPKRSVSEIIEHPNYDTATAYGVALLKLNESIDSEPVRLPEPGVSVDADTAAHFVGWRRKPDGSGKCIYVNSMSLLDKNLCEHPILNEIICAERIFSSEDCPNGGEPLIIDDVQVGIAMIGSEDCNRITFIPIIQSETRDFIKKTAGM